MISLKATYKIRMVAVVSSSSAIWSMRLYNFNRCKTFRFRFVLFAPNALDGSALEKKKMSEENSKHVGKDCSNCIQTQAKWEKVVVFISRQLKIISIKSTRYLYFEFAKLGTFSLLKITWNIPSKFSRTFSWFQFEITATTTTTEKRGKERWRRWSENENNSNWCNRKPKSRRVCG